MPQQADFDVIAKYYDLLYANRADDLEMYLELTADINGPLLEVGCGTGRLLMPLAKYGREVTGIDISVHALQTAQAAIDAGNFNRIAHLYQADMRTLNLPKQDFPFAFLPINTLMHCLTLADQQATLSSLNKHLQTGGNLLIDLYHPHPQTLLEADGRLLLENQFVDEETGTFTQWFVVRHLQLDEQIQDVTFILDQTGQSGLLTRRTFSFPMRYVYRFEMELLLNRAGFEVQQIWGDYDLSPFYDESPRMIFMAQKIADIG